MNKEAKIYVAGHRGLVGSALVRVLGEQGYDNLIVRTHSEMDLQNQEQVIRFFESERPEYVFLAAAMSAGFTLIIIIQRILSITICRSRTT